MLEEYFDSKKIPIWESNYIDIVKFRFLIKELSSSSDDRTKRFITFVEEEVKRIYIFYSSIEREVYLTINKRINLKKHYFKLGVEEIYGEMKKLKQISIIIYNFIKYINLNIGLIQKMTQEFSSAFPNDDKNEVYKYFYYEVNTLNSDINYIFQYKIIDEVTVILDEFVCNLLERMNDKQIPFKMLIEEENTFTDSIVDFNINTDNLQGRNNRNYLQTSEKENEYIQKTRTISSALNKSTTYSEMKILEGSSSIKSIIDEYKLRISDVGYETRRNIEYIELTSMEFREGVLNINNFSFIDNKLLVNDNTNNHKHNLSILGVGYDDNIIPEYNKGLLKYEVYVNTNENSLYTQIRKNIQFIIAYNFIYNIILYMPISQIYAFIHVRNSEERVFHISKNENSYLIDMLILILSVGAFYFLLPITNYFSSMINTKNIKPYFTFCNILLSLSCLVFIFQNEINSYLPLSNHSHFNIFCENSKFGILVFISRVLLSFSSTKSLSKKYISVNSPKEFLKSYIINYNYSNYFGLIVSFLFNMILIFSINKKLLIVCYSLILFIHFVFFLVFLLYFNNESSHRVGSKEHDIDIDYVSNPSSNISNLDKKKENLLEENSPSASNRKYSNQSIQTNTIQLTIDENNMISRINKDLSNVNKIQNFTSTNYLGLEIETIINKEMNTFTESRFISKSFFLLLINTFIFKFAFEGNLLLFSFLFVVEGEGVVGVYHISLIMFVSLLMIVPFYVLAKNVNQRKGFVFSIFFLSLIYFGLFLRSSLVLYIILLPFIIGFTFFNELYISRIINEVIPKGYTLFTFSSELVVYNLSFWLKGVYFVMIGVVFYKNPDFSQMKNMIFLILSIFHCVGLVLNMLLMKYLKGKAICRVINNRF